MILLRHSGGDMLLGRRTGVGNESVDLAAEAALVELERSFALAVECEIRIQLHICSFVLLLLVSPLEARNVDFVHLQHGLHDALGFFRIGIAHQLG